MRLGTVLIKLVTLFTYNIVSNALRPSNDPQHSKLRPYVVGVIGLVYTDFLNQLVAQLGQLIITSQPPTTTPASQDSILLSMLLRFIWCNPQN